MTIPPKPAKKRESIQYRCTDNHKKRLVELADYYEQSIAGILTVLVEREHQRLARMFRRRQEESEVGK